MSGERLWHKIKNNKKKKKRRNHFNRTSKADSSLDYVNLKYIIRLWQKWKWTTLIIKAQLNNNPCIRYKMQVNKLTWKQEKWQVSKVQLLLTVGHVSTGLLESVSFHISFHPLLAELQNQPNICFPPSATESKSQDRNTE